MAPISATQKNRPIVVSGPSGSGKSTILKKLLAEFPDKFGFSVSHTTRAARPGEQDGKDYYFTSPATFEQLIHDSAFIEHAQFGGNRYGTSFQAVEAIAEQGRICILDIEMEGVKQVHKSHLSARFLFLSPPSPEILEQRLRGRGTDSEEAIQKRLRQAVNEMEYSRTPGVHDRIVVNDELERAYQEVKAFVLEE